MGECKPLGMGLPVDSDSDHKDTRKCDDDDRPGRFLHAEAASLRMGDVPAMLAELQGALIALA